MKLSLGLLRRAAASLLGLTLFAPLAHADYFSDGFEQALNIVFQRMMTSYHRGENSPLQITVLNVDRPLVRRYLERAQSSSFDPKTSLAISYDPATRVDGKLAATCLVQYNPARRSNLLLGYEASGLFTRRDTLYYLAAHEFGHCMVFHQAALGHGPHIDVAQNELIADEVAIAFFVANHQPEVAEHIIDFNRELKDNPDHYHPQKLQHFFDLLTLKSKDHPTLGVHSMLDLYKLAIENTPLAAK